MSRQTGQDRMEPFDWLLWKNIPPQQWQTSDYPPVFMRWGLSCPSLKSSRTGLVWSWKPPTKHIHAKCVLYEDSSRVTWSHDTFGLGVMWGAKIKKIKTIQINCAVIFLINAIIYLFLYLSVCLSNFYLFQNHQSTRIEKRKVWLKGWVSPVLWP